MAAGDVTATEYGRTIIANMRRTIQGGLSEQIRSIVSDGDILCQPDVWEGSLAAQHRSSWPNTSTQLREAVDELTRLNELFNKINADIMAAGGNAV